MKTYWLSALCVSLLWLLGCDVDSQRVTPDATNQEDATQTQATSGESDTVAASPSQEPTDDPAAAIENDAEFFVIDVRSEKEFAGGNVDGSVNIPHTEIVEGIKAVTEDKSANIYFY